MHDGHLVVQAGPLCFTHPLDFDEHQEELTSLSDISALCHHVTEPQGTFLPGGLVFARISTLDADG